ncbi:phospholipase [Amylibacter marinus]|uniref:Phospholipase n=1 Tax=Amylibacter marinus TaxID=1475483 RepID=A0ABQ5VS56_9RHOB|nr:alpha/beta fold hydrolase [Amylibacter marinus]GLQ34026.1 phospholipase [Amylibacter marinus]
MTLTSYRKEPKSGTADSLVVFLHGFGADGKDLLGLADPLADYLPNTVFVSPDAPSRCSVNPMGYQWFPIPRMDGSSEEAAIAGMQTAVGALDEFLDELAESTKIAPQRTVLVGFSQGTMMSLHVAPRRAEALAGVVGFSGLLRNPQDLEQEIKHRSPVLLVHGDADDVVPYAEMAKAADVLAALDVPTYTHTSPNTAHGIAPDGLSQALAFIKQVL